MGLFFADAGEVAKEAAIEAVERNAEPSWLDAAWTALLAACKDAWASRDGSLVSDDVWLRLYSDGVPAPHDPRAMGPVMQRAVREGLLLPTSTFRPSAMPQNHRRPVRVYVVRHV
jgi:hypothetical protein